MHALIRLDTQDPLFDGTEDRLAFMRRARRLARRWGVSALAFRLEARRAALLVEAPERVLVQYTRLLRSGHAIRSHHHRRTPPRWRPGGAVPLPPQGAEAMALELHRGCGGHPWSSLWDALGLRRAAWWAGGWGRENLDRAALWERAGLKGTPPRVSDRPAPWASLPRIEEAVDRARGGARGEARVLTAQVARGCGWTLEALCALMNTRPAAVRRAWRLPPRPGRDMALTWLRHPVLRASLDPPWADHAPPGAEPRAVTPSTAGYDSALTSEHSWPTRVPCCSAPDASSPGA